MNIRKFFLLSLSLAVLAVGLHLTAMSQVSRGLQIRAHAVTLSESDRVAARAEASRYSSRGAVLSYVGLVFALGSAAFVIASARRHEPARRIVVFGALICYVLWQLVLV
jgi:hypothetical protein